jgi:hypothetical protein
MLAVLCTNLKRIEELTWNVAEQLLRESDAPEQSRCPTKALREHWREICRNNCASNPSPSCNGVTFSDEKVNMDVRRSAWESTAAIPPHAKCETFQSPLDPDFTVQLNLDSEHALLTCDVSPEQVRQVLQNVEELFIAEFWGVLSNPSPHDPSFPYALCGSRGRHTLIDPVRLYASLSWHRDVHSSEASQLLRKYSYDQLTTAIRTLRPSTVRNANALLTENGRMRLRAIPLAEEVDRHPTFDALVNDLIRRAMASGRTTAKAIAQYALIGLRNEHWIILPEITSHIGTVVRGLHASDSGRSDDPLLLLTGELSDLYRTLCEGLVEDGVATRHGFAQKAIFTILCTNLRGTGDLSMPLVERILELTRGTTGGRGSASTAKVRSLWQTICEQNGPRAMLSPLPVRYHRERLLAIAPEDRRLEPWINLLAEHLENQKGSGNLEPFYTAFNNWMTFLATLDEVPSPTQVQRRHIFAKDGPCFRKYLEDSKTTAHHRNMCLAKLDAVFEEASASQENAGVIFVNPIKWDRDRFEAPRNERPTSTVRSRLQSLVLDELKRFILEPLPAGEFRWGDALHDIDYIYKTQPDGTRGMCPILPAIIYIMLTYPTRGHHTRWLDSGEMDERQFDYESGTFRTNEIHGIRKRQSGVIQCENMYSPGQPRSLDFRVAVNKTPLNERMRSAYDIPFVSPDVLWVIKQVMKWQKAYGPPPTLVKEVHEPIRRAMRNQKLATFYPDICPLFRFRGQKSFYPPSPMQLTYFWGSICGAWDRANASWTNPTTGNVEQRPGVPILSRQYRKTTPKGKINVWYVARFDLHSLRVAGVSYLLDEGVPLAFVAQIAGQKSLAMAAYYYKPEAEAIRFALHDAWKDGRCDLRVQELMKLVQNIDNESWMMGTAEGIERFKRARETGMFMLTTSGICPGASCSTGIADNEKEGRGSPVPGSRCPLCRYFVYGPPFVLGLIYDANCLLRSLERKSRRQAEIRRALREAEDRGDTCEALRLRGEDDRLDQGALIDTRELFNLHRMIKECKEREISGDREHSDQIHLMKQDSGHVDVVVEQISQFTQLKCIVEFSQVLHPSRHIEADLAALELKDLILTLLRRNGVPCYLAGLPKEESTRASLQLARILERTIPEEDNLEKLFKGAISLRDMPSLEAEVMQQAQLCNTNHQ